MVEYHHFSNHCFIQFDGTPYFSAVGASVFTGAATNTNANIEERGKSKILVIIFPNLTLPNVTSFNKHHSGHLAHLLWSAFRRSRLDVFLRIVETKILKTFLGKYHCLFQ